MYLEVRTLVQLTQNYLGQLLEMKLLVTQTHCTGISGDGPGTCL